jgi:hypothetical protein
MFEKVYGYYPFSYSFVDEDLQKLYLAEQQMGKLFNIFSVLSVSISCLGLFRAGHFCYAKTHQGNRRKESAGSQ